MSPEQKQALVDAVLARTEPKFGLIQQTLLDLLKVFQNVADIPDETFSPVKQMTEFKYLV